jgi:hypothetical protein
MCAGDKVSADADGVRFDLQDILELKLKQPSYTQACVPCLVKNLLKSLQPAHIRLASVSVTCSPTKPLDLSNPFRGFSDAQPPGMA